MSYDVLSQTAAEVADLRNTPAGIVNLGREKSFWCEGIRCRKVRKVKIAERVEKG
jgi:hypothetical protein